MEGQTWLFRASVADLRGGEEEGREGGREGGREVKSGGIDVWEVWEQAESNNYDCLHEAHRNTDSISFIT